MLQEGKSILPARRLAGLVTQCPQQGCGDAADVIVIVDHQDAGGRPAFGLGPRAIFINRIERRLSSRQIKPDGGSPADVAVNGHGAA